ncbi:YitT family protein [Pontibacillus salicampi]|uniref:YitT family protein n=1 Tax=Pontibacillus salicampi TaxID=1449801 RepID=A0ABV6LI82_9BACI
MLYRVTVYLLGMFINFFGVALIINATLGAGFWTSFFIGLSDKFGFTVGLWYGISQFIIIFINAWLMKQGPEYRAIIPVLLESVILDFWLEFVFARVDLSSAPFLFQIGILITGVIIVGLGVAVYILPQFPRAPVDQLFLAISSRFNLSLRLGQTIVAAVMASAAFLIGGPVGLGTLAGILFLGPAIQMWYTRAYPMYYRFHPAYQDETEIIS